MCNCVVTVYFSFFLIPHFRAEVFFLPKINGRGAILTNFAKCHSCNHHFQSYEIQRFSLFLSHSLSLPFWIFWVVPPTCYEFCRCQRDRRRDFQFPHSCVIFLPVSLLVCSPGNQREAKQAKGSTFVLLFFKACPLHTKLPKKSGLRFDC